MASSSTTSCSNTNTKQRKHFSIEHRPRMLKDFLRDHSSSCSSSGFKSFPSLPCADISIRNLIEIDLNARTRSKLAATTIFSFHSIINTIKNNTPFATVKSPFLPRTLSRRLSKKKLPTKSENKENDIKVTVTVKDIIRWRSFRDLMEEKSQPLDSASSPHHCTTNTTTGSTISTPSGSSSNGSSWCDSDFTSEYLLPWSGNSKEYGENEVEMGKNNLPCVGGDSTEATTFTVVGPKGELACEEKEQHSPVSVLHFQFEEDEFSSFDQSLADMKRTKQKKLIQKIRRLEIMNTLDPINLEKWMSVEENTYLEDEHEHEKEEPNEVEHKARQLLTHVMATTSVVNFKDNVDQQQLLLDFFRDESASKRDQIKNDEFDCEMVRIAKAWINGERSMSIEWGVKPKRVAYVKEMDKEGRWTKYEEEQQELALKIENGVLVLLVDELLVELLS